MSRFMEWLSGNSRSAKQSETPTVADGGMTAPTRSAIPSHVTVDSALSIPTVFRAIQIHATAAKQLSIETHRYGMRIEDHPLTRRPDATGRRSAWIEQAVVSLATSGNAFFEIIRDAAGDVASLPVLNPLDVVIRVSREGRITGYSYRGRDLTPTQVQHCTYLRVPGTAYGLGPIQAANAELHGTIATRDYAAQWLDDSQVPTGVLKSDQHLNPDQARAAKTSWAENVGQRNGVVVLGNGLSYSPIFLTPKDVQFLESQQFSVTQIARMFGIPAGLLLAAVEGNSQTYTNVVDGWLEYIKFTLTNYLVEIEEALTDLLPGAQRAVFNIEAFLRTDTKGRYESYGTAIDKGFMTVNEVRRIEGLPDLPTEPATETPA